MYGESLSQIPYSAEVVLEEMNSLDGESQLFNALLNNPGLISAEDKKELLERFAELTDRDLLKMDGRFAIGQIPAMIDCLQKSSTVIAPETEETLEGLVRRIEGHIFGSERMVAKEGFNPFSFELTLGEEAYYNNRNELFDGEPLAYSSYNILLEDDVYYFKSNGLYIACGPDGHVDMHFTPRNAVGAGTIPLTEALARSYRGFKNLVYAMDTGQLPFISNLEGETDPVFAHFLEKFGLTPEEHSSETDEESIYRVSGDTSTVINSFAEKESSLFRVYKRFLRDEGAT